MSSKNFLLFVSFIIAALFLSGVSASSKSLTIAQYANAAALLGLRELAVLKAIDSVESGGSGRYQTPSLRLKLTAF
jgi:hypothetical protein